MGKKCGKTSWLEKLFVLCIKAVYQLWVERYNVMHESTMSKVIIEGHHALLLQVRRLYRALDICSSRVM